MGVGRDLGSSLAGVPYGIRTRVAAVKGRCPRPLDEGDEARERQGVTGPIGEIKATEPEALLREADEAIRGNLQARASAVIHRYGELGHPPRPVFDLLLRFAVSEDGALHAEKYWRTATAEYADARPAFRDRHLVALARVTASEFGRPAPGVEEARRLLGA